MPAAIEADRTYRTLGILWLLYAILRFAGAVFILIYRATLTLMWGALVTRVPNPFALMSFFHLFLVFAMLLNIVAGIFALLAARALLGRAGSSRRIALVASFFALIDGPLGIALGAYTLVVFVPHR
ncbi:MAG TPA: hypothetical protein VN875_15530 [Candidatus Binatus sp.]|jgi:hypothetical protein|nr:hypothetical protein [Candidatus Binatus sp.]